MVPLIQHCSNPEVQERLRELADLVGVAVVEVVSGIKGVAEAEEGLGGLGRQLAVDLGGVAPVVVEAAMREGFVGNEVAIKIDMALVRDGGDDDRIGLE